MNTQKQETEVNEINYHRYEGPHKILLMNRTIKMLDKKGMHLNPDYLEIVDCKKEHVEIKYK